MPDAPQVNNSTSEEPEEYNNSNNPGYDPNYVPEPPLIP